ncbi:flagellar assembly protein FliX [Labrenzia sp. CE80]|uniref:flagellar assembly protein FliX n=1 Tax=Labrenzia sp. CE80 TaxID=1788986 RepID=UPI00129A3B72|nr:flagellar assembly protein FliX [Labrenzia sp. CE80]
MRITGQKPVSGVQGRGAKKRSGATGDAFTPEMGDESSPTAATTSAMGVQGMDALLALQEVGEDPERRRKAARHGHSLLDGLEAIKTDLLGGLISEDRLEALAHEVGSQVESGDEEVDSVLREIELRVKVELAKLGRFTD